MSYVDPMTGLPTPLSIPRTPVPPQAGSVLSPFTQSLISRNGLVGLPGAQGNILARGITPPPITAPAAAPSFAGFNPASYAAPMGGAPSVSLSSQAAEATGRGGGLLSRFGGSLVANPEARGLMRFAAPGMTRLGAASRLGGWGLAGQAGGALINQLNIGGDESTAEQALRGAAQGAGIGAGIGSVVPGIGTGVGAAIGGGLGAVADVLDVGKFFSSEDDGTPNPEDALAQALEGATLPMEIENQIVEMYDAKMELAKGLEGDARKAEEQAAYQMASQLILEQMAQVQQAQQAQQQAPIDASRALALQAQSQQVFQPLADDIRSSAGLYAQAMGGLRDMVPESYRPVLDTTVARELTSADKLANAYMAQAALTPMVDQLTRYQQDQDAFAQQLFSQALAQQASAMGQQYGLLAPAGGGSTANDLMAQLAG